ncbi:MAG: hypothetical protein ACJ0RN_00040 [Candidatus Neomarinimicrobiota bacterium]
MLYFLIDNTSLSVYNHSKNKQSLALADKVKFHIPLLKILNNSKKLNSVIARSLDELSEKVSFTNNRASIVVDDSLLSHSVIIKSKKYKTIDEQLKKEASLKWGEAVPNLYFISEEKKSPKNVYHSIAIHHFLREKIKLNFNNFGMNIIYLVPLSSVLTTGLKSSQFATIKNGKKFTFFTNTKKGFMFFKANFSGANKSFEKIIGLLDIPKIQLKELDKSSLRFIFFNRLKIVEYLDNFISKDVPLLNFVETNRAQIIGGKNNSIKKTFIPLNNNFDYTNLAKNVSSAIVSMLFLFLIISFFSDYKFLDTKERTSVKNVKEVQKILSVREAALSASFAVINKLEIAMSGNTELNNFIVTDDVFDVNNQKVDFDDNISVLNESNISASYNELLIKLFEIDSNLKFKVFDSMFDDKNAKNLVLRFKNEDSALDVVNEIKNFNNMFLKKASFSKDKASVHLYITIIEP